MPKAILLYRNKDIYSDGALVEMKVWLVPRSSRIPDGIKYSLVYIDPQGHRVLGYDNAEGKGHHRHCGQEETKVFFESIDELIDQFLREVGRIRRNQ